MTDTQELISQLLRASHGDEHALLLDVPDRVFGFHSQQAVEKFFKVLIAAHGQEFPFIHNRRPWLTS